MDSLDLPDSLPAPTWGPHLLGWRTWLGEMVAGQHKHGDDCPLPGEDKGQACMPLGLHEAQSPQVHLVPCLLGVYEQCVGVPGLLEYKLLEVKAQCFCIHINCSFIQLMLIECLESLPCS